MVLFTANRGWLEKGLQCTWPSVLPVLVWPQKFSSFLPETTYLIINTSAPSLILRTFNGFYFGRCTRLINGARLFMSTSSSGTQCQTELFNPWSGTRQTCATLLGGRDLHIVTQNGNFDNNSWHKSTLRAHAKSSYSTSTLHGHTWSTRHWTAGSNISIYK